MQRAYVFFLMLLICTACNSGTEATSQADELAVRQLVDQFGKSLQLVSLQAPTAAQQVRAVYAPFVAPQLLEQWVTDPEGAPGRVVSSPWPDRIAMTSMTETGTGQYVVTGDEIMITSMELGADRVASKVPVKLTIEKQRQSWLITGYERVQTRL